MRGNVAQRRNRFYAVIYEGIDPMSLAGAESALRGRPDSVTCPEGVFGARTSTENTGGRRPCGTRRPGRTGQLAAVRSASRARFSNWRRAITRSPT